jgi:hypothetical protein
MTVIAERVGWSRSVSVFRARLAQLRPLFAPTDTALRTTYAPGELVHCDLWFPPVDVPVGFVQVARLPVLTMASGYSWLPAALMIPSRQEQDLVSGRWEIFTAWVRVPRTLVW